ncbi:MAG: hypothetical protein Tsb009_33110 [Planctomycetaceae bacterium]
MHPLNSLGTRLTGIICLTFCFAGFVAQPAFSKDKPASKRKVSKTKAKAKTPWTPLFDGKTLKGWQITKFGGEGEVTVKKGQVILGVGADMTGIHTKRKLPTMNYEVELEAMRVDGSDFFCGFTFPVGKSPCSLIIGGWGGGVCGLSSIDGMDASENETTTYRMFKKGKWYRIRLRVTNDAIQAWLDGKQIVNQKTKGKKISIRTEVEASKPFGFATWQTTGALRNLRIRKLAKSEIPTAKSKKK